MSDLSDLFGTDLAADQEWLTGSDVAEEDLPWPHSRRSAIAPYLPPPGPQGKADAVVEEPPAPEAAASWDARDARESGEAEMAATPVAEMTVIRWPVVSPEVQPDADLGQDAEPVHDHSAPGGPPLDELPVVAELPVDELIVGGTAVDELTVGGTAVDELPVDDDLADFIISGTVPGMAEPEVEELAAPSDLDGLDDLIVPHHYRELVSLSEQVEEPHAFFRSVPAPLGPALAPASDDLAVDDLAVDDLAVDDLAVDDWAVDDEIAEEGVVDGGAIDEQAADLLVTGPAVDLGPTIEPWVAPEVTASIQPWSPPSAPQAVPSFKLPIRPYGASGEEPVEPEPYVPVDVMDLMAPAVAASPSVAPVPDSTTLDSPVLDSPVLDSPVLDSAVPEILAPAPMTLGFGPSIEAPVAFDPAPVGFSPSIEAPAPADPAPFDPTPMGFGTSIEVPAPSDPAPVAFGPAIDAPAPADPTLAAFAVPAAFAGAAGPSWEDPVEAGDGDLVTSVARAVDPFEDAASVSPTLIRWHRGDDDVIPSGTPEVVSRPGPLSRLRLFRR